MGHVIHRYYPPVDDCESNSRARDASINNNFNLNNVYYDYKCVWTPDKISYYINGDLIHEVVNTGQEWYPNLPLQVKLSQQIINPDKPNKTPIKLMNVPQTSYFDKVVVKKLFPSPSITCPNLICTTGSAIMDVDPDATNISWYLSPTSLFSGAISGTGKFAPINRASGNSGEGTITYFFEMPSGETFDTEKIFWVGKPANGLSGATIEGPSCCEKGSVNNYFYGSPYPLVIGGAAWYNWSVHPYDANIVINDNSWNVSAMVDIGSGTAPGFYTLRVKAENDCGENDEMAIAFFEVPFTNCGSGGWFMSFSPNPTTGETTLTIESISEEKELSMELNKEDSGLQTASSEPVLDENTEWELEIYSPTQALKEKRTKLKGKSTTIQTHGWKEGVYVVRVKYKDEIMTGKLVVKK